MSAVYRYTHDAHLIFDLRLRMFSLAFLGQLLCERFFLRMQLAIEPIHGRRRQCTRAATGERTGAARQQIRGYVTQQLVDVRVPGRSRILDRLRDLIQLRCELRRHACTRSATNRAQPTAGQPARQRTAGNVQRNTIVTTLGPIVGLLLILCLERRIGRVVRVRLRLLPLLIGVAANLLRNRLRLRRRLRCPDQIRLIAQHLLQIRCPANRPIQIRRLTIERRHILLLVGLIRGHDGAGTDRALRARAAAVLTKNAVI